MKKIFIFLFAFTISKGQICAPEADWCFSLSMNQAVFMFYSVEINGEEIDPGSVEGSGELIWSCPNADCDIIGAFFNDICVGWIYPFYNGVYSLPVLLNDGNLPDYPLAGDIVELRLYDSETQTIYSTSIADNSNDEDDIINEIPPIQNFAFYQIDLLYSTTVLNQSEYIEYSLQLYDGWNLISFYALPEDTSLESIFSQLGTNITTIYGNGVFATLYPGLVWMGSLNAIGIELTSGYWVELIEPQELDIIG